MALAYVLHKAPYVFPIVGGRKVDHLKGNIEALGVELTDAEVDWIEDAVPFDPGFPLNFLFGYGSGKSYRTRMSSSDMGLVKASTALETVPKPRVCRHRSITVEGDDANGIQPIEPRQGERNLGLS